MIKNKLKFLLIMIFFSFLFVFNCAKVRANDSQITVESIEGLVYGNKLKDAVIYGNSNGIIGEFSFYNNEMILDDVGEITLEVVFVPQDSSEVTKINYVGTVEKRKISVVFETPIYKQYDSTDNISLPNHQYVGIVDNEVSVQGNLTGKLSATYVSEGIDVILSGVEIVGEKSNCYYLDLLEHSARIYPLVLEKSGVHETKIILDKDVYVDVGYSLKVEETEVSDKVDGKYTGFKKYSYLVYSHNNVLLDVEGNFDVRMKVDEETQNKRRMFLFELTKAGEYKQLDYSIDGDEICFSISSNSSVVFVTRDVEYHFIILFSAVLIFYLLFVIVYGLKNSRIKPSQGY